MAKVPHEITLMAFIRHPDGDYSVYDIVETSFRYAYSFWSRFRRNPEVALVRVIRADSHSYRDVMLREI